MRKPRSLTVKRLSVLAAVAWLILGLVLAFTWANWFVPTLPVVVVAGLLALMASALLLRRSPALLQGNLLGKFGTIGMGAVFFWFGFALTLPAAATSVLGTQQSVRMDVVSYGWGSSSCRFRLVVDALSPPGGGFCRAGEDAVAFRPGEVVEVTVRRSALGTHVLNFSKPQEQVKFNALFEAKG